MGAESTVGVLRNFTIEDFRAYRGEPEDGSGSGSDGGDGGGDGGEAREYGLGEYGLGTYGE